MEVGFQEAGIYSSREKAIYWDGKSQDGEPVSSGVYFYSLELDWKSKKDHQGLDCTNFGNSSEIWV